MCQSGGFWLLFHTSCKGVRRIQRTILGQTYSFSTSSLLWQSLVRCFPREGYRNSGFIQGDDFRNASFY